MEKEDNILISIITVSFNSVKTIEKTILSVLNQTYKNIEYIIIDGGSTDGTVDIIRKYQDKIKYWVSEPDKGVSDAFNKGILVSHGYIIGIINSDDWYETDTIKSILELEKEKKADVYVGSLRYWENNKKNTVIFPDTRYKKTISFRMPHLNHPASFFKRKTYEDIGIFDVKYKYAMDYDIFLKVFLKNKNICFTEKILANMLSGGTSNIHKKEAYKEVYIISKNKLLGLIWYFLSLLRRKIKSFI